MLQKAHTIDRHKKIGDYYLLSSREVHYKDASAKSAPDVAVQYKNLKLL